MTYDGGNHAQPVGPDLTKVRDAWATWLAGLAPWHLFMTATVDPKRQGYRPPGPQLHGQRLRHRTPGAMSVDVFRKRVLRVLRDGERDLGRRLILAGGVEMTRAGAPHLHAMVSIEGGLLRGNEVAVLGRGFYEALGYTVLEIPHDIGDAAGYCGKYIVKSDPQAVIVWPGERLDGYLQQAFGSGNDVRES